MKGEDMSPEKPTMRDALELENTEYDYGHDVPKRTNDDNVWTQN